MSLISKRPKEMCQKILKKASYKLKYALDQYKTQDIFEKDVPKYSFILLKYVPDQYRTQKLHKNVVPKYPFILECVIEQLHLKCLKTFIM